MKTFLYLLPVLFPTMFTSFITAQDNDFHFSETALPGKYQTETIYLRFNKFGKNGQWQDIGIVGEGLKPEMVISPDAMTIFKKYQRQKRWSLVCAGLQIVTEVAALTTGNKAKRTGLHIGGVGISLIAVPIYIGSYQNLNKSVWIRNGDVLK